MTEKTPSSTRLGSRFRRWTMRSYSSGFRPNSAAVSARDLAGALMARLLAGLAGRRDRLGRQRVADRAAALARRVADPPGRRAGAPEAVSDHLTDAGIIRLQRLDDKDQGEVAVRRAGGGGVDGVARVQGFAAHGERAGGIPRRAGPETGRPADLWQRVGEAFADRSVGADPQGAVRRAL